MKMSRFSRCRVNKQNCDIRDHENSIQSPKCQRVSIGRWFGADFKLKVQILGLAFIVNVEYRCGFLLHIRGQR